MQTHKSKVVNGLILAAGLSRRMGEFKPLMRFGGKTLIECTVESMLCAGVSQVVLVLGYRGEEIEAILKSHYGEQAILEFKEEGGLRPLWYQLEAHTIKIPVEDKGVAIDFDTQQVYATYANAVLSSN